MTDQKTTEPKTSKPAKPWLKRKRVWGGVILILLVYFCLVPSRTRISPETTGITGPLTAEGKVDYFAAFEKLYIDKLSPPEDNGLRYMIAACGPRILEQNYIADTVPWEEMPTHEDSKRWFETQWIPLCEHLYIDPYERPMFYDLHGFYGYMRKYKEKQKAEVGEENFTDDDPDDSKLFETLTAAPWSKDDYPVIGQWLDEYSPVLDYFGQCVRMPNYACWRSYSGSLIAILLPDVQASRDFARSLQVRVNERVARGDIDGAWYDVMSMKHIAVHFQNEPIFVTNLVGLAIDGIANLAAQQILTHGNPTQEQLEGFLKDLSDLPRPDAFSLSMNFERLVPYEIMRHFKQGYGMQYYDDMIRNDANIADALSKILTLRLLPFDANIAGERLTELYGKFGVTDFPFYQQQDSNPVLRRQYVEQMEKKTEELRDKLQNTSQLYRAPLIRTRSRLLAEYVYLYIGPAVWVTSRAFDRMEAQNEMLRLAVALEHYKMLNGEYPATLDALVPTYFPMVPLDPFTGRKTLVYKVTPDGDFPFALYSFGPNAKDDNALSEEEAGKAGNYGNHDVVFWYKWEKKEEY